METIKYEAVFGDQSLFDGSPKDCFLVIRFDDKRKSFICGEVDYAGTAFSCDRYFEIAMRRIIKTPVWTVADQKAGRLPEVGCRVDFCHKLNTNWRTGEIKYIDNQVTVIKADDIDRPFVYEFDRVEFNPIETPAEKSQREEDEFVDVIVSEYKMMPNQLAFKAGIRAAYRKLKGGE